MQIDDMLGYAMRELHRISQLHGKKQTFRSNRKPRPFRHTFSCLHNFCATI